MREESNRTVMLLLVAAIVISVVGTLVSINRLNQAIPLTPRVTGLALQTTGKVNLSLAKVASLSVVDGVIVYGSCSPNASYGANLSSNVSNNTAFNAWDAPGVCNAFPNSPDNITVKNDGNSNVNITVETNSLASSFIGGTTPRGAEMWFAATNSSDSPGCYVDSAGSDPTGGFNGGLQWNWTGFVAADTEYLACANLTPTANLDSMYVFIKVFLPADTPVGTGKNATLTFTAVSH